MIDVIKDVFNVEKLDGAMREFGNLELTLLKVSIKTEIILRIKKTNFKKINSIS